MLGTEEVACMKTKRKRSQKKHAVKKLIATMTSFPYPKALDSLKIKRKKRKIMKKRRTKLKNFKVGSLIEYKPVTDFHFVTPLYGEIGIVTKIIPKIGKDPMRIYVVFSMRPEHADDLIWDKGVGWYNPIDFEIISN